jgi:hypothetical protein
MALVPEQEIPIPQNGTTFLIAAIRYLEVPDEALEPDGFVHLIRAGSLAGSGLDGYVKAGEIRRFSYARPSAPPHSI